MFPVDNAAGQRSTELLGLSGTLVTSRKLEQSQFTTRRSGSGLCVCFNKQARRPTNARARWPWSRWAGAQGARHGPEPFPTQTQGQGRIYMHYLLLSVSNIFLFNFIGFFFLLEGRFHAFTRWACPSVHVPQAFAPTSTPKSLQTPPVSTAGSHVPGQTAAVPGARSCREQPTESRSPELGSGVKLPLVYI